jgi:hypothetical protein
VAEGQTVQTYTVFEKRVAPEDLLERAGDLVFVKEGFSFWTLIAPAIWLLVNRLWRGLLLYLLLSIGLIVALTELGADEQFLFWGGTVINLIFAFEARDIYRAALERRGYVLRAVVSGRNLAECERRFLQEWLPMVRRERDHFASMAATGAPAGGGATAPSSSVPVIGMFPAHGG